jgi:AraC family transcriptional regulator
MRVTALFEGGGLTVANYACCAKPGDASVPEHHSGYALAFVQSGSFGYLARGERYELVAGSLLLGRPGEEYRCTHDHHLGGDECLSFHFSPELIDALGADKVWPTAALPPLAELAVLGELARTAALSQSDIGLDEAGLLFAQRFLRVATNARSERVATTPVDRRRAVRAALYLEARSSEPVTLADAAREVGLSTFHLLRVFSRVLGLTPHQYLLRTRLRHAARLLAEPELPITQIAYSVGFNDLSNFTRTFRRATGVTPTAYRAGR